MSNKQPFLLLVSSLTLLGCSQAGSNANNITVPTGNEVEKEVATAHYAQAVEAMNKTTAFGANLVGGVNVSQEFSTKMVSDGVTTEASSSTKLSVNDISASLAMSIGDDAKMSAKVSANYSYSRSVTGIEVSGDPNVSQSGKASLATYLSDGTLYADLSGLADFLTSSSDSIPLKRKTTVPTQDMSWDAYEDFVDDMAEKASESEYLQVKEGTYSLVYTFDPSTFVDDSGTSEASWSWKGEVKAWLSFTDEGFTEAGISGSLKYESAYSFYNDEPSYRYESQAKIELGANLKASFLYGDNVKVEEVADPDSYVDVSVDFD